VEALASENLGLKRAVAERDMYREQVRGMGLRGMGTGKGFAAAGPTTGREVRRGLGSLLGPLPGQQLNPRPSSSLNGLSPCPGPCEPRQAEDLRRRWQEAERRVTELQVTPLARGRPTNTGNPLFVTLGSPGTLRVSLSGASFG
jgi:hypothetical protein